MKRLVFVGCFLILAVGAVNTQAEVNFLDDYGGYLLFGQRTGDEPVGTIWYTWRPKNKNACSRYAAVEFNARLLKMDSFRRHGVEEELARVGWARVRIE